MSPAQVMGYQDTIDYLFGLQKHGIKFGLANSHALMELMGGPHRMFRSIHVAGTNGKGSTALFLASVLQAAGFRVGLYTSPHLVSFTERIRINGTQISEDRVVELAARVRERSAGVHGADGEPINPTFFEVTTAIAFTYFAEERADIVVVETGMGGRLDSTNVITPLVSVITNIDREHTEYLGDTIGKIAAEKAGIIKPGVPVVTGTVQPEAIAVLEARAAEQAAPLFLLERDFGAENIAASGQTVFDFRASRGLLRGMRIAMLGRHQVDNACLALAAVERLQEAGIAIDEAAVRGGLEQTVWEGRLERVARQPDVYLDGAHNPAAALRLADALRELRKQYRRLILVVGILADKDAAGILAHLAPLAGLVVVTKPQYSRALDPARIVHELERYACDRAVAGDVEQAIAEARRQASDEDLIVVTGSLYVVGDARAFLREDASGPAGMTALRG